jgi:hypothetical protein
MITTKMRSAILLLVICATLVWGDANNNNYNNNNYNNQNSSPRLFEINTAHRDISDPLEELADGTNVDNDIGTGGQSGQQSSNSNDSNDNNTFNWRQRLFIGDYAQSPNINTIIASFSTETNAGITCLLAVRDPDFVVLNQEGILRRRNFEGIGQGKKKKKKNQICIHVKCLILILIFLFFLLYRF